MEIKTDTVYSIKMISGEEIVAKVTGTSDEYVYVNAPLGVAASPQGLQLVPALFTSDKNPDAAIPRSAITVIAPSREDVGAAYTESVTGIQVPSKQIVTG